MSRRTLLLGACALPLSACASQIGARQTWRWADSNAIVAVIRPTSFPARDFAVALSDRSSDARPLILAAIDMAHNSGGGRVVLPDGDWLVDGPLHLKSNVNLHLSARASLTFSGNHASYLPAVFTRWEGIECWNYSPLIYAKDQSNIAVTGRGKINGQGATFWLPWRAQQRADQTLLRDMGRDGLPVAQRQFGEGKKLRPCFVEFINCQRVLLGRVVNGAK